MDKLNILARANLKYQELLNPMERPLHKVHQS